MTHACVSKLTIIGSDNGLSPDRRQTIIWTNDGMILSIRNLGTNLSEILSKIHTFSFTKMHLQMSSAAISSWPQCLKSYVVQLCITLPQRPPPYHICIAVLLDHSPHPGQVYMHKTGLFCYSARRRNTQRRMKPMKWTSFIGYTTPYKIPNVWKETQSSTCQGCFVFV